MTHVFQSQENRTQENSLKTLCLEFQVLHSSLVSWKPAVMTEINLQIWRFTIDMMVIRSKIYVGVEELWRIHIWTIYAEAGKPPGLAFLSSRLSFLFSSCSSTTMASWLGKAMKVAVIWIEKNRTVKSLKQIKKNEQKKNVQENAKIFFVSKNP